MRQDQIFIQHVIVLYVIPQLWSVMEQELNNFKEAIKDKVEKYKILLVVTRYYVYMP